MRTCLKAVVRLKKGLRAVARWTGRLFRLTLRSAWIIAVIVLLAFNAATVVSSTFAGLVSGLVAAVTGMPTAYGMLRREASVVAAKNAELVKKSTRLETELAEARAPRKVRLRGKVVTAAEAVAETTGNVSRRTAKAAAANLSSMPAEGIPVWGIAVIVAATGYEIATACETMRDMEDLRIAMDPTAVTDSDTAKVCGMHVPTAEELRAAIAAAPAAAWESAKSGLASVGASVADFGDRLGNELDAAADVTRDRVSNRAKAIARSIFGQ